MAERSKIRMIALDLDRTTLKEDGTIPERTVRALNEAGERGVQIVIATGRVRDALPSSLRGIKHISYYLCSNGASVFREDDGEKKLIYDKCLAAEAVELMTGYVREKGYMFESFTEGSAYIGRDWYEKVDKGLVMFRGRDYVLSTRIPVDDIYGFTLEHKERIENLNVFFPSQEEKEKFRPLLAAIPEATLTSSVPSNYELGGKGVSKGDALKIVLDREDITSDELMAAGDSPNDISMLKLAGLSVAVANAEEPVKEVCSFTVPSNEDAGVGYAVEKYVLQQ